MFSDKLLVLYGPVSDRFSNVHHITAKKKEKSYGKRIRICKVIFQFNWLNIQSVFMLFMLWSKINTRIFLAIVNRCRF